MIGDTPDPKPYKVERHLAKWEHGRTPDDGPPDAVVSAVSWHDPDGTPITDPTRIADLEARVAPGA